MSSSEVGWGYRFYERKPQRWNALFITSHQGTCQLTYHQGCWHWSFELGGVCQASPPIKLLIFFPFYALFTGFFAYIAGYLGLYTSSIFGKLFIGKIWGRSEGTRLWKRFLFVKSRCLKAPLRDLLGTSSETERTWRNPGDFTENAIQ